MLPCSHTCSFKTVEEECWTAIQMTYKVIEDTLRIYVTSFLYIASLSVCAELSTLLGCISVSPGISFVFRLMSSYFWAPVIIRMTNLITTMVNVHSPHRVCGGDLLRMLQITLKSELLNHCCFGFISQTKNDIILNSFESTQPLCHQATAASIYYVTKYWLMTMSAIYLSVWPPY